MNKVFSLYGGKVSAQTGVSTVIVNLDDQEGWNRCGFHHCIASLDSERLSGLDDSFSASSLKDEIRSSLRKLAWRVSEKSSFIAKIYVNSVFFRFSKYVIERNFERLRDCNYIFIHDLWSLIYIKNNYPMLLQKSCFVSHSDGDVVGFVSDVFPKLKSSRFLKNIQSEYAVACNAVDCVVALSDRARSFIINEIQLEPKRVKVIYNGISKLDSFNNDSFFLDPISLPINVNITGTVCARKRQYLVLEAVEKIVDEVGLSSINVNIYGDGPELSALKLRFENLINGGVLKLHGFVRAPFAEYVAGDVFLLASRTEGLPMAAIEAARAGSYLVLTNVGGCGEICGLVGGTLLEATEESELKREISNVLKKLIAVPSIIEKNYPFCMSGFVENFTRDAMVDRYVHITREYNRDI